MVNRSLCIALIALLCFGCLAGCSDFQSRLDEVRTERELVEANEAKLSSSMFQLVASDEDDHISYYRDVVTDVMYVYMCLKSGYSGMGGISVMLSPDGSPLLYSEWSSLFEEVLSDD